jgi:membrane protease YdiL (CAAX protease family)
LILLIQMSLKYNCPHCGFEIITKFLNPGDTLFCPECKVLFAVPSDAIDTDSESSIRKTIEKSNPNDTVNDILNPAPSTDESFPPEPTPWGVASILKFIGASLAAIFLFSCIVAFIIAFLGGDHWRASQVEIGPNLEMFSISQQRIMTFWGMIFSSVFPAWLIYYSVVRRHHHANFFEAMNLRRLTKAELWRFLKIGGGFAVVILGLALIISLTSLKKLIPDNMPLAEYLKSGPFEVIVFTINGLIAPFSEELIFRGYIFQGLRGKCSVLTSAIIVSVVFTLMHGTQLAFSPIPLIFIAILSVILIYTRIKTDSLTNCIVVHLIYNSILISVMWLTIIIWGFDAAMKM